MRLTKIEWTERTWNPTTGCTKISAGCINCYAYTLANRLKAMGVKKYRNKFRLTIHSGEIEKPFDWKSPSVIFVNSMSDLFHEDIPDSFISRVFATMSACDQHIFQVLTKRTERMAEFCKKIEIKDHIWMGTTVESSMYRHRIDLLRKVPAKVRFLSIEPILSAIPNINLSGISWVIVGGESGPHARTLKKEWIEDIQKQCRKNNIRFFFKQWGGMRKKQNGNLLNGKLYQDYPDEYKEWERMLNDRELFA